MVDSTHCRLWFLGIYGLWRRLVALRRLGVRGLAFEADGHRISSHTAGGLSVFFMPQEDNVPSSYSLLAVPLLLSMIHLLLLYLQ